MEVITNDFTNELGEKKKKLIKYEKAHEILKMKDEIIWNMMQEKKNVEEKELGIIKDKTRTNISDWKK
jgi:hypothetical protein